MDSGKNIKGPPNIQGKAISYFWHYSLSIQQHNLYRTIFLATAKNNRIKVWKFHRYICLIYIKFVEYFSLRVSWGVYKKSGLGKSSFWIGRLSNPRNLVKYGSPTHMRAALEVLCGPQFRLYGPQFYYQE